MIPLTRRAAALALYTLARMDVAPGKELVSLSQNESLRPPSPKVGEALLRVANDAQGYPDPDWRDLRRALADAHGVDPETILCGNGSMDLIAALFAAYTDPDNAVALPAHAYPFFRTAAAWAGARVDLAPEVKETVSIDALLQAVRPDTRLVCLANPANPTGTRITRAEIDRLRAGLRDDVLLVIDEAYGEFADHLCEPVFDRVAGGNVIVLRTFSKAYGLAGLRIGWGVFPPDVAAALRRVLTPNAVSLAAQHAARAALADPTYMAQTCEMTARNRHTFATRLRVAGFDLPDSFTNFVLIRLADEASAASADAALRAEGIVTRAQGGVGLAQCLRVTVGAEKHMDRTAQILERWMDRRDR